MKLYLLILMAVNFGSAVLFMFIFNYMLFATPNHGVWLYESNPYILTGEAITSTIFVSLTAALAIKEVHKIFRPLALSSVSNRQITQPHPDESC